MTIEISGQTVIDQNRNLQVGTITTGGNVDIGNSDLFVGDIYLRDKIYHHLDTHTYIGFDVFGDEVNVNAGGYNLINANLGGVEVFNRIRGINHSNSYLEWHDTNQMRMVVAAAERLEVKHTSPHVLVSGDLEVTGSISGSNTTKAWVNFNGASTVSMRDSENVSSITDNSTGNYSANFSNALTNANYCCNFCATDIGTSANQTNSYVYGSWKRGNTAVVYNTNFIRIGMGYPANTTFYDQTHVNISIVGD